MCGFMMKTLLRIIRLTSLINYFCMNWGWNDDNDNRWYHIGTGSWHTEFEDNGVVTEEYNFDYERAMITDFEPIN